MENKLLNKLNEIRKRRVEIENLIFTNVGLLLSLEDRFSDIKTNLIIDNRKYDFNRSKMEISHLIKTKKKVKKEIEEREEFKSLFRINTLKRVFRDYKTYQDGNVGLDHSFNISKIYSANFTYNEVISICKPFLEDFERTRNLLIEKLLKKLSIGPVIKICQSCNKNIETDGVFCSHCGEKV